MSKIFCPQCHHILGDTNQSFDGQLNCRWCNKRVGVKVVRAKSTDYFRKEEDD